MTAFLPEGPRSAEAPQVTDEDAGFLELAQLLHWPSWAATASSPVSSSDILVTPPDHPGSGDSCSKEILLNKA